MPAIAEPRRHSEDLLPAGQTYQNGTAAEQRLVLYNVPWERYEQLCELLGEHKVRLAYQQGSLEIMAPSMSHGCYGYLSARAVDILAEEMAIPILPGGSVTLKSQAVDRGIEPDNCYWIASELQVRDKTEIDLDLDPPPDLFVEIEITHSFLDRLEIAAKLNVAEVWRFDASVLKVLILQPDGTYSESDRSKSFPGFPVKDIAPFLKRTPDVDYITQMRRFREWVRDRLRDSPNG
jgi:Uma2 family endonuclease